MAFAFDTLGYSKKLRDSGVPQDQAEAHAEAAREFIMVELVTKSDLLATTRALQAEIRNFEAKLDNLGLRLTVRVGIMLAAGLTLARRGPQAALNAAGSATGASRLTEGRTQPMPTGYAETYRRSLERPEEFWAEAAEAIDWERRWDRVLDRQPAAVLPLVSRRPAQHLLERARPPCRRRKRRAHGADLGQPGHRRRSRISPIAELRDAVARLAGVLAGLGVGKGDRVLIYMPMVPQAAMAMLACARIGAIHSVVFGGFAAHELATRIDDARPRAILAASCGIEVERIIPYKPLLDAAIAEAKSKPEHCLVLQRPMCRADLVAGRDHDWDELAAAARPADCVPVLATDPLYILYTSGTTGIPKGVVRDNGGHAVALRWSLPNIYGVAPDEVFWTASDVGWVVGHSYIVYAPLLLRLHHGHVRGQAGRHPRRRRLLAGDRAARGPRVLYRADRIPRDQARGPRRAI